MVKLKAKHIWDKDNIKMEKALLAQFDKKKTNSGG